MSPGPLGAALTGGYLAAELAVLPLLDVMGIDMGAAVTDETSTDWDELGSLMRAEVNQAVGVLHRPGAPERVPGPKVG